MDYVASSVDFNISLESSYPYVCTHKQGWILGIGMCYIVFGSIHELPQIVFNFLYLNLKRELPQIVKHDFRYERSYCYDNPPSQFPPVQFQMCCMRRSFEVMHGNKEIMCIKCCFCHTHQKEQDIDTFKRQKSSFEILTNFEGVFTTRNSSIARVRHLEMYF